jgi:MFS family permease
MWLFVTGRAVQGFGAGLNIVALYVVVGRAYPEAMRPRLFSAMSSAWVLPALVGPSVAGLVADRLSWRWVFLAVPPLIVPAVLLMLPRLTHLPAAAPGVTVRRRIVPALAVAVGAALLQYAGQRLDWLALVLVVVAVAVLTPSLPRLLPAGTLVAHRGLPTAVLVRGVLAGAFFGAEAFLPLMLVEQRGLATAVAGLALTGGALSWSLGSWYQGRPGTRLTRARLVQRGTAVIALGIAIASLAVWDAVPPAVAAAGWVVAGLGMGVAMPSVNLVMLRLSPQAEQGFNSAALQVSDAVGSIVLIGLGGAVFAGLHQPGYAGGHNAAVFAGIYAVMAAAAVAGALVAPRLQPRGDTR